jgi:hypothetical protein
MAYDPKPLEYHTPANATAKAPGGSRGGALVGYAVFGLILALACVWLAFGLAGLGHGWSSACSVSGVALITYPLSGVAWAMRRRPAGKAVALFLLLAAIVADFELRNDARAEDNYYFERVWSNERADVIAWAALWFAWQVVVVAALVWPPQSRPAPNGNQGRLSARSGS